MVTPEMLVLGECFEAMRAELIAAGHQGQWIAMRSNPVRVVGYYPSWWEAFRNGRWAASGGALLVEEIQPAPERKRIASFRLAAL